MSWLGSGSFTMAFRCIILASSIMLICNVVYLNDCPTLMTSSYGASPYSSNVLISSDFWSSFKAVEDTPSIRDRQSFTDTKKATTTISSPWIMRRYPRTIVGIFSTDSYSEATYRSQHRKLLLDIWKDDRTCNVQQFLSDAQTRQRCQLLYTFIIGGAPDDDSPTERLEDKPANPLVLPKIENPTKDDVNAEDVTILNIRENMNEGKSQTFFYYASTIMDKFQDTDTPIDYAMKLDSDSILSLHDFFLFAHENLPPAPFNINIFVGSLRDKAIWAKRVHSRKDLAKRESYWAREYSDVHLYLAGQCYLMSYDLCRFVAEEAPYSKTRIGSGGYLEGHEDHDISSMVYHNPTPIHLITLGKSQQYWDHPIKGQPRWLRLLKRERARMNQETFEGKQLRIY